LNVLWAIIGVSNGLIEDLSQIYIPPGNNESFMEPNEASQGSIVTIDSDISSKIILQSNMKTPTTLTSSRELMDYVNQLLSFYSLSSLILPSSYATRERQLMLSRTNDLLTQKYRLLNSDLVTRYLILVCILFLKVFGYPVCSSGKFVPGLVKEITEKLGGVNGEWKVLTDQLIKTQKQILLFVKSKDERDGGIAKDQLLTLHEIIDAFVSME
jgi:hypothetical protein